MLIAEQHNGFTWLPSQVGDFWNCFCHFFQPSLCRNSCTVQMTKCLDNSAMLDRVPRNGIKMMNFAQGVIDVRYFCASTMNTVFKETIPCQDIFPDNLNGLWTMR